MIATGLDVEPAVAQLQEHPELWNAHPARTQMPGSPHHETSDIWLRFRDPTELDNYASFGEPHFAVFYPAWHTLHRMQPLVFGVMHAVNAVYLGGILITRLPPGGRVYAHHDRGSWHAEYLDKKVYVILKANERCDNWCEDEQVTMRAGQAWQFENLLMHGVCNGGLTERLALIVTMRGEP